MDFLSRFDITLSQRNIDFINNNNGDTFLVKLIRISRTNIVIFRNIINEYCKINPHEMTILSHSFNTTPLQISTYTKDIELLKIMLKNGANIHYHNGSILDYLAGSWEWDLQSGKYFESAIKLVLEYDATPTNRYNFIMSNLFEKHPFVENINLLNMKN